VLKTVSLTCVSLYAWLMTFAVTGWFLRFAGQHQPWLRYLADASYWCYLAHMVPVLWLQIVLAKWEFNGPLKFILINAITMALLLGSYHVFVRYTFIGRILNGPRQRPTKAALPATAAGTV
jgi:peptidoglycan/LPS O-acetylase OafA/YrhL